MELGPQPVLSALTMGNISHLGEELVFLPSLRRKEAEWTTLLATVAKLYVAGFNFNWANFDQYYGRSKISLPFYPFHRKYFWYNQGKEQGSGGSGALTFSSDNLLHPLIGTFNSEHDKIFFATSVTL